MCYQEPQQENFQKATANCAVQDQQLENCLERNNLLPGTATGKCTGSNGQLCRSGSGTGKLQEATANDQQWENFRNMAMCHQDLEPELGHDRTGFWTGIS